VLRSQLAAQVAYANGIDAVVLSGTALYQNDTLRSMLLKELSVLGITLDATRNAATICREGNIATADSVPIYLVKGDEASVLATLALDVIASDN
jgi:acetate kinase